MIGAFGIDEWGFQVYIDAPNKEKASEWGNQVTKKYDKFKRLRPDSQELSMEDIEYFAMVLDFDGNEDHFQYFYFCKYGEYPDFSKPLKEIQYSELTPEREIKLEKEIKTRKSRRQRVLKKNRNRKEKH